MSMTQLYCLLCHCSICRAGCSSRHDNGLFSFLRRKFSNLLYPYILLLIIGHFCEFLYSAPNWFLFSLFVNNLVGYGILFVIQRLFKGRSMYAALLIVSIILSYIAYNCHIDQSINSLLISKHIGFCESAVVELPLVIQQISYLLYEAET